MKSLLLFNNKGGVGKTTLTCNLVHTLNSKFGKRVLLIDADPQCNSTQAILSEDVCEELYFSNSNLTSTLYDVLKPFELGDPTVNIDISPILGTQNRYNTDLIPGHPKMSIIEDRLSDGWSDLKGRELRGFRITNWAHILMEEFRDRYDIIIFDVGPSLGALNRSILLASDYVLTPFGCDIFSLLGIHNIAGWLKDWNEIYDSSARDLISRDENTFSSFNLLKNTKNQFRFIGYSVQQYQQRKFKEGPRPVKSYDRIMQKIPETVRETMGFLNPGLAFSDLELGHIPYVYSLIPLSQSAKAPISELQYKDGLVGSANKQAQEYSNLIESICQKLIKNMELSNGSLA